MTLILTRSTKLLFQLLQSKHERTRGKKEDQSDTTAAEAMIAVADTEVVVTVDSAVDIVREIEVIPMIVDVTLESNEALIETITGKKTIVSVKSEAEA